MCDDDRVDLCRHQQGSRRRRHLKIFATPELAKEWIKENDPEGVIFGYEVIEE
jgi:hypothetical protein